MSSSTGNIRLQWITYCTVRVCESPRKDERLFSLVMSSVWTALHLADTQSTKHRDCAVILNVNMKALFLADRDCAAVVNFIVKASLGCHPKFRDCAFIVKVIMKAFLWLTPQGQRLCCL